MGSVKGIFGDRYELALFRRCSAGLGKPFHVLVPQDILFSLAYACDVRRDVVISGKLYAALKIAETVYAGKVPFASEDCFLSAFDKTGEHFVLHFGSTGKAPLDFSEVASAPTQDSLVYCPCGFLSHIQVCKIILFIRIVPSGRART